MFVISGATGHTGSTAATTLLAQGKKVRIIARDAAKAAPWKARGAEVVIAELEDVPALTAALRGAAGAYLLVPPNFVADDPLAAQAKVVTALAQAVTAAKPAHVVLLSSIGAELPSGTGPIITLHHAEAKLRATGVPVTALRATYFMENWGGVAPAAKSDGVLPSMLTLGRAGSMVATGDIGRVAAGLLVEGATAGDVIELVGPREYTPEEVAAAFSRVLNRPVKPVPVPDEAIEPALLQAGLKPKMAALYREMCGAFNRGTVRFAHTPRRGTIEIDEVVRSLVA